MSFDINDELMQQYKHQSNEVLASKSLLGVNLSQEDIEDLKRNDQYQFGKTKQAIVKWFMWAGFGVVALIALIVISVLVRYVYLIWPNKTEVFNALSLLFSHGLVGVSALWVKTLWDNQH
ncbi:MAG: hypothetical protein VKJ06_06040 [Vampirovibrionales bacterium]|nr:hypothetical protein [Vampirovibrionales bacterium]